SDGLDRLRATCRRPFEKWTCSATVRGPRSEPRGHSDATRCRASNASEPFAARPWPAREGSRPFPAAAPSSQEHTLALALARFASPTREPLIFALGSRSVPLLPNQLHELDVEVLVLPAIAEARAVAEQV